MKAIGNSIYTFFEDHQGRLWIGTLDNGLVSIDDDDVQIYKNNLPHPLIWGIGKSPAGSIYVALKDASFARLNGYRLELLSQDALLFDQNLRQAFKNKTINFLKYYLESDQYINLALACWDGEQLKHFTVAQGLPGHEVTDIAETTNGKLWVATLNTGLACLDVDLFRIIVHQALNNLSRLITLHATTDSALWILSQEEMAFIKQDSITVWGSSSKLVAFHTLDIQSDRNNQILFSDETSLYYFNVGDILKLPNVFNEAPYQQRIMPFFILIV